MAGVVFWVGNNGNIYARSGDSVEDWGKASAVYANGAQAARGSVQGTLIDNPSGPAVNNTTTNNTSGGGAAAPDTTADDLAFLADQEAQLRSLLGRTDTGLAQGLTKLEDDYNTETGYQNAQRDRAISNYNDQRVGVNKDKLSSFGTINRNAGNGYRSLSQIIGRASGTGSSAYQQLLPDVIGKDISGKRKLALENAGTNFQKIDKSQADTELSFSNVLADLLKQRKTGESDLRAGIEGQRQSINSQLATNAGERAKIKGGGYSSIKAAQAPYQAAIENSRNAVESFFNQFRTPYTRTEVAAKTPELSTYTADRSSVNAQQQGVNPDNPYAAILRKKLQGEGI